MQQLSVTNQSHRSFIDALGHRYPALITQRSFIFTVGAFFLATTSLIVAYDRVIDTKYSPTARYGSSMSDIRRPIATSSTVPSATDKTSSTDPPPVVNSNGSRVVVNGQDIPVTPQSSTSRSVTGNNGTTTVNISNQSSQNSNESSSSNSLNVSVTSSSTTSDEPTN